MQKKQVLVVIPAYKNQLTPHEAISLAQAQRILQKYPKVFAAPEGLTPDYGELSKGIGTEHFAPEYFKSTAGYSRLLLNADFYRRFEAYEYILIYQLDAFVFKDELKKFCAMGYDYIGAPVAKFEPKWYLINARIGNGGFSLRKISSAIRMLTEHRELFTTHPYECLFNALEDLFWGYCGTQEDFDFRVPPIDVASRFALQDNIRHEIDKAKDGVLPFGIHAWDRYHIRDWYPQIKNFGYQMPPPKYDSIDMRQISIQHYLKSRKKLNLMPLWGMIAKGQTKAAINHLLDWRRKYQGLHVLDNDNTNMHFCLILLASALREKAADKLPYDIILELLTAILFETAFDKPNVAPPLWLIEQIIDGKNVLFTAAHPHAREKMQILTLLKNTFEVYRQKGDEKNAKKFADLHNRLAAPPKIN